MQRGETPSAPVSNKVRILRKLGADFASRRKWLVALAEMPPSTARSILRKTTMLCK
jgi:hypothetical protein